MKHIAAIVLLASLFHSACAQVSVKDAWVRATVPQQTATGAFMRLQSASDARLIEVRSPAAASIEMHETTLSNNMMRMRAVASLDLPAGKPVEFRPGGYHIMLLGLKGPLKEGESVALTLVVESKDGKREDVPVKALVRPLTAHGGGRHGH